MISPRVAPRGDPVDGAAENRGFRVAPGKTETTKYCDQVRINGLAANRAQASALPKQIELSETYSLLLMSAVKPSNKVALFRS